MKLLDKIKEANKIRKAKKLISSLLTFQHGPNYPMISYSYGGGGTLFGDYTDWKKMFFVQKGIAGKRNIYSWSTPHDLSVCTDTVKTVSCVFAEKPESMDGQQCTLHFSNGKTATLTPFYTSWRTLEEMFQVLKVEEITRSYFDDDSQKIVEVKHFDGDCFSDWERK